MINRFAASLAVLVAFGALPALAQQQQPKPAAAAATPKADEDRYVGYYEGYAENHVALDEDHGFQEETRNAARALIEAVKLMRRGKLAQPDRRLEEPRPK